MFGVSPTTALLLRRTLANQVAHDHHAGCDADAHLKGTPWLVGSRHRLDEREPGPHGAFGVVLVRLRIAEVDEHAVAQVLGDEPASLAISSARRGDRHP